MKRFDGTEIAEADAKRFRDFVRSRRWIFATTYAAFCPHEYALRRESRNEDFVWFAKFVWENGFDARYGKNLGRYFIDEEGGYYYFVFPVDVDENENIKSSMTLINRASLKEWYLVEEGSLFETWYRWKRKPPERRGTYEGIFER